MTISRGQMYRQLKNRGGIMQLEPRQQYGLGSLVKSVTGAVKSAVGGIKDLVSSDVGKLALLAAGGYYLGGGALMGGPGFTFGQLGTSLASPFKAVGKGIFGAAPVGDFAAGTKGLFGSYGFQDFLAKTGASKLGISGLMSSKGLKTGAAILGGSALMSSLFGSPEQAKQLYSERPSVVREYLAQYYRNVNKDRDVTDAEVEEFVNQQTREYAANGGRIGFNEGKSYRFMELIDEEGEDEYYRKKAEELDMKYNPQRYTPPPKKPIDFEGRLKRLMKAKGMLDPESFEMLLRELESERPNKAYGGPMGEPRENQGGIMELDYRKTGGFVPIGIKEKADDVPAMLSKNEFVMTADAVRGAGNGDVEKGAQRMYKVMKTLENGGTV